MIGYIEAIEKILSTAVVSQTESVDLTKALNRILARDVHSDVNLPPFNKSAMDGYACRKEDIENELYVIENLPAGKQPMHAIGPNECAKIMTGAVIPEGADLVFMQEHAKIMGNNKVKCTNPNSKTNICYLGEDIQQGDLVLAAQTLIRPQHLPILAGAGCAILDVYKQPRVAIFSTGTELVDIHEQPAPHQIRNTNSVQLMGQLENLKIQAYHGDILKDDKEIIEEQIQKSLETHDLLLLTGGVSVGEYDLIPQLLENAGFDIIIEKTAIQPGRPMIFAHRDNQYCFGLSGNPVSSYIQFELYVKPFIYKWMGHNYQPARYQLPLQKALSRKKTERLQFKPAKIVDSQIAPIEFHGSAHINSLADADCLIEIPVGVSILKEGELATIRII